MVGKSYVDITQFAIWVSLDMLSWEYKEFLWVSHKLGLVGVTLVITGEWHFVCGEDIRHTAIS